MKKILVLTALSILVILSIAYAQKAKGNGDFSVGLVYGKGHAFFISAPEGWVLDNSSGVKQGLCAVFYPKGATWQGSPVVMYVHSVTRRPNENVDDFIKEDVRQFKKKGSSDLKVVASDAIKTKDGNVAQVRIFTGDRWGNSEAVAYISENKIFVIIAFTSRTLEGYKKYFGAFQSLVGSYQFVTEDVHIEK